MIVPYRIVQETSNPVVFALSSTNLIDYFKTHIPSSCYPSITVDVYLQLMVYIITEASTNDKVEIVLSPPSNDANIIAFRSG